MVTTFIRRVVFLDLFRAKLYAYLPVSNVNPRRNLALQMWRFKWLCSCTWIYKSNFNIEILPEEQQSDHLVNHVSYTYRSLAKHTWSPALWISLRRHGMAPLGPQNHKPSPTMVSHGNVRLICQCRSWKSCMYSVWYTCLARWEIRVCAETGQSSKKPMTRKAKNQHHNEKWAKPNVQLQTHAMQRKI